jgi:cobyrinic acid a,c-diamide synthase
MPSQRTATARIAYRIGVARDKAFGFYYPDDLMALESAGAKLSRLTP